MTNQVNADTRKEAREIWERVKQSRMIRISSQPDTRVIIKVRL